ncbi:hypothetical protein ACFQO1_07715 [Jejudonia soesokkakensis]|uniref:Uncharacterized protein n=1 Tax=Jejudonia soesokkakensis TaxID=1323432 RepID=A0ABW2MRQ3_9FLAO
MRHTITLLSIALLLIGCNSAKRTEKFLSQGNYEQAIELAVKKLAKDKDSRQSADLILSAERAFKKLVDDELRRVSFLKKDDSPTAAREIYEIYTNLDYLQSQIRPLLPLYNRKLKRNANFDIVDYNEEIIIAKNNFLEALYTEALSYMERGQKQDYRRAHTLFTELSSLRSNYKDVAKRMEDAHYFGTDFVFVTLQNRTGILIPRRLERDLLDFSTYNLDDFWTVYHSEKQNDIDYDFGIVYSFKDIAISPERINEREYNRKDRIKTGWEYKLDRNGNVMKDSLGNDIKIDVFENVTARVTVTQQTKSVLVGGDVIYRDLNGGRDIDRFPLSSEFIFENIFAKYRGDKRALLKEDLDLIRFDFVPFPSNEQMVYDAGTDIKIRLTEILQENRFY